MNKINVTDARKDMSTFFDGVIHEKPIILKRRKNEAVLVEKSLLRVFLSNDKINVKTISDKDKVSLLANEVNVLGEGETRVDAINNLCDNLFAYANDVYNNFMFYFYGQNIKEKLCYVFNILLCEDNDELKTLLDFSVKKAKKVAK